MVHNPPTGPLEFRHAERLKGADRHRLVLMIIEVEDRKVIRGRASNTLHIEVSPLVGCPLGTGDVVSPAPGDPDIKMPDHLPTLLVIGLCLPVGCLCIGGYIDLAHRTFGRSTIGRLRMNCGLFRSTIIGGS
jgi:hypothetical protein